MGIFDSFFGGGGGNPADKANEYLNKIPGAVNPYYQPFINAGRGALNNLQGEYGKLTNDPNAMYNKFGAGYKESPGYQFRLKQALGAGQNASAAGGMLGTPQDQQQQMQIGEGLASQDYENYLNHILGLYGQGLQGQQGIENQGFGASTGYGDILGQLLGQQAQYGYAGQAGKNQSNQAGFNNVFNNLSQGIGALFPYLFPAAGA